QNKAAAAQLGITPTDLSRLVQKARTKAERAKHEEERAAGAEDKARRDAERQAAREDRERRLQAARAARKPGRTPDGAKLPAGFTQEDGSFWYTPPPTERKIPEKFRVCAEFRVIARTSDEGDREQGLLLRWTSPNGVDHQWAMPKYLTHLG